MTRCEHCFNDVEDLYTAYLPKHEKVENVCKKCKQHLEQHAMDEITYNAVESITDLLNGGSSAKIAESLFRSINRHHRYLQNELFLALWKFFEMYGKMEPNQYDARNEGAVNMAKRWNAATFER